MSVATCKTFARSCDPIPYKMVFEVSRSGIDCSGFVSVVNRCLLNQADVWRRCYSTGTIKDVFQNFGLKAGKGDPSKDFEIGVMYPWESPSGIGHMAATLAGLNLESRGGVGVLIGDAARSSRNSLFGHHFHLPLASMEDDMFEAADRTVLKDVQTKLATLREDLAVFGTTGLEQTVENFATRQREALKLLEGLSDDEAKVVAAIKVASTQADTKVQTVLTALAALDLELTDEQIARLAEQIDVDEAAVAEAVRFRLADALSA